MTRSVDNIIEQMRDVLRSENSELADFPEFGNLYSIYRSVATAIVDQNTKIDTLSSNLFLNTATGEALDNKAREFGIRRRLGTPSTGGIIVLGGISTLPVNTILSHPRTGLQFTTIRRTVLTAQRGVSSIQCTEFTSLGNLPPGTELISSVYPNVKFIIGNSFDVFSGQYVGGLVGGNEREEDETLRSRILSSINALESSTTDAIRLAALNINGISRVVVADNDPALGYITVYINNSQTSLIRRVEVALQDVKPIGVALSVKPFTSTQVDISLTVTALTNTSTAALNNQINATLQDYLNNLEGGISLTREGIAATVLNLPDVTNVAVNIPTANIEIGANELLTLNNLNITYT